MKKTRKYSHAVPDMPRKQKISFMLNEEEYKTIHNYLSKYKITNRSRWYRETILSHILKVLEHDYPTLFSENEMRR
jgi:NADH:ubiquinone oxidoreductase subunit D